MSLALKTIRKLVKVQPVKEDVLLTILKVCRDACFIKCAKLTFFFRY